MNAHHEVNLGTINQSYIVGSETRMSFVGTTNDTVTVAGSGDQIDAHGDTGLNIIFGSTSPGYTAISLDGMKGITNISNFNVGTDHIGLYNSGYQNAAEVVAALKPGHFGETLALAGGASVHFNHSAPLTVASFVHVS